MLILNNLKTQSKHFVSDKTYRKGNELHTCILCPNMLINVCDFCLIRNESLPSDHAPIYLSVMLPGVDKEQFKCRTEQLGDLAELYGQAAKDTNTTTSPINTNIVDVQLFLRNLSEREMPDVNANVDESVTQVAELLYTCVENARCLNNDDNNVASQDRWERILNDKDNLRIWKAVNWKGEYEL